MLDPRTLEALERMDREGGVELPDAEASTARRLVRHGFAERGDDGLLWITDLGLERLEECERERNVAERGKRTDTERWVCTGRRVGRRYSYACRACGATRMMAPNSVWLAQCPKCCEDTHPAEAGREINGFRLTGVVSRRPRRSEDRYKVECMECGLEGSKTMWELQTRRNGCKRCSAKNHGAKVMRARDCLVGETYGHWEVTGITPMSRSGHRKFEVRCTECGNEILQNTPAILSGRPCANCARLERMRERDRVVMSSTFGPWTPIGKDSIRPTDGTQLWRFRCTGGHERVAALTSVRGTKYCQRCHEEGSPDNAYKVGDKVNGRKITAIDGNDRVTVVCPKGHETFGKMYNMRHHGCGVCNRELQRKQRSE